MMPITRALVMPGLLAAALVSMAGSVRDAGAAPPASIRVQGSLSDRSGGPPVPANGTFAMTFSLYPALTGGAAAATAGPMNVPVQGGLYNAEVPFPPSVFDGASLFLEVAINGEVLAPRIPIVSVPYAYQSGQAVSVAPGSIVSASIAPGGVASANLAAGAVTADKLGIPCADGQVLMRVGGAWTCATPPVPTVCNSNDYIACYDGPESTIGVGPCRLGRRACTAGGTFGPCTGQVLPATEVGACDGIDNDCDGAVDDSCSLCGNGVLEPFETCDDHNTTAGDGCDASCQAEPGHVCSGQPSVCVIGCDPGFSNCDGIDANGCECATSSCCGPACASRHQNGLGQFYEDCSPPGTPGAPETYTQAMANEARAAWNVTGSDFAIADYCGPQQAVLLRQTANSCAVWIYTGVLAGYVRLNSVNASCLCPLNNTYPSWN